MSLPDPAARVSSVLMVRNLPAGITEQDLEAWARRYVYVNRDGHQAQTEAVKVLLVPDKQLGFVQMVNDEAALRIMTMHTVQPGSVTIEKDGKIYFIKPGDIQYADKEELKQPPKAKGQVNSADRECRILLVVLKDLTAAVQLTEIFWLFSQFGKVEKISSFVRNNKNQVLVQFAAKDQASLAMSYLNGKKITFAKPNKVAQQNAQASECKFAIVPSRLPQLTFKNQDKSNRDYAEQNAFLEGELEKLKPTTPLDDWMRQLAGMPMRLRLLKLIEKQSAKFYAQHKSFIWGKDITEDGRGILVPKQKDPSQYGTIPPPEKIDTGIPDGQVGDCAHFKNLKDIDAQQLWRLASVYGDVVAAKLLYKYPGSAIVQYRNKASQAWCTASLNNVDQGEGQILEVQEGKNPNAMHWSGAGTELEANMVTIMTKKAPPVHPASVEYAKRFPNVSAEDIVEQNKQLDVGTTPTANVLLWCTSEHGLPEGMEESIQQLVLGDLAQRPGAAGVPMTLEGDVVYHEEEDGKGSYAIELGSAIAAIRLVCMVNGELSTEFRDLVYGASALGVNLQGAQIGATFISDDLMLSICSGAMENYEVMDGEFIPRTRTQHVDPGDLPLDEDDEAYEATAVVGGPIPRSKTCP